MKIQQYFLFSILIISFTVSSYAQEDVRIKKKKFVIENKSKTSTKRALKSLKEGEKFWDIGQGTYLEARENFLKAANYNENVPELNYKIGVCYLFTDDKYEAIKYLTNAYEANKAVAKDIHFWLARAYHQVLDFDKAIAEYRTHKEQRISPEMISKINKYILECEYGKILINEPQRVIIKSLGEKINSKYDDYNSIFSADEKTLYFTSKRSTGIGAKRSIVDNKYYEDIYKAVNIDNEWQKAQRVENKKINDKKNEQNNAVVGLSKDGKKLYLYNGREKGGDIYVSEFKAGKWKKPKSLKEVNTKGRETTIAFSNDGKVIYFTSDYEKLTRGGSDIFMIIKKPNGKWSKPANIGSTINTKHNEFGVCIADSGKTMYFSSDGHNTMGGYDVFSSKLDENGRWGQPVNVGYPINSPDDDLFYTASSEGKYAYYTTIRENSEGSKDIFKVIFLGEEKEMLLATESKAIAGNYYKYPGIFFKNPEEQVLDTSVLMKGKILDINTLEPLTAKIELVDQENSAIVGTSISTSEGFYKIKLPGRKVYGVEVSAPDYLLFLEEIDLNAEAVEEVLERDFKLSPIDIGTKVVLENIFFETGKATLKTESLPQIEQVKKLLNNNPSLRIEISGHTDNIGSLKGNMKLSTQRAESVANKLIEMGIEKSRIEFKGYAYTQPIAPNNTEEGRKLNRRVEFKILSK